MTNLDADDSSESHHDIIIIGGSSGALAPLKAIVRGLPADLQATVFVITHVSPEHESLLPDILGNQGNLPVVTATHGAVSRRGYIYVAPPDFHLIIEAGFMRLWRGPKENHSRPSLNPTFRSAAKIYGKRVVAVILSGFLDDGTAGMIAVKRNHGVAIVQDPREAEIPDMPRNAMRYIEADYVVPAAQIAPLLVKLTHEVIPETGAKSMPDSADKESIKVERDIAELEAGEKTNGLTMIVCPDCGGPLWEFRNNGFKDFQCRVGHKFSPENILAHHAEVLERALWVAVRTLDERASLTREMANVARHTAGEEVIYKFENEAEEAARNAEIIRRMLLNGEHQHE
ncbi:MAG TPA: chemotaxis protein CheB [Blastocatellia bacterium]|nr:chemotaxis protein CheB [Blastocatellia bacterium]